jgi:hypothetical protein
MLYNYGSVIAPTSLCRRYCSTIVVDFTAGLVVCDSQMVHL